MTSQLLLPLVFMPFCATLGGVFLWLLGGTAPMEDSVLLRKFVIVLATCMLVVWKTSELPSVRIHIDPAFRLQTELEANPVYAALQTHAPDDQRQLGAFLAEAMAHGASMPEALLQARPLLTHLTNERMGFADQKTRIAWARVTLSTLKVLQARDASQCYRAMASQPLDPALLASAFSREDTAAFDQAVAAVYTSATAGMAYRGHTADIPVDFNQAAREFSLITDALETRFGEPVARQVARKDYPMPPPLPAEALCAARIAQLEAMLDKPQNMAAMLVDSILR